MSRQLRCGARRFSREFVGQGWEPRGLNVHKLAPRAEEPLRSPVIVIGRDRWDFGGRPGDFISHRYIGRGRSPEGLLSTRSTTQSCKYFVCSFHDLLTGACSMDPRLNVAMKDRSFGSGWRPGQRARQWRTWWEGAVRSSAAVRPRWWARLQRSSDRTRSAVRIGGPICFIWITNSSPRNSRRSRRTRMPTCSSS